MIGNNMKEGWKHCRLGEVCTIERGGSPRPISDYITDSEDGINWIKIGDASDNSKYITSTKEKIKKEGLKKTRFVHKGDFILSNSMSFGKPYILDIDGCIHDGWLVIHDDDNVFIKEYLYYVLSSPNMYKEFERLAVGGVVNNLNSQLVRNVIIAIPSLEQQHQIVSELDLLSGVIEKQKRQLKELDTLAQSIFYDMFGDPMENEKGWRYTTLQELIDKDVILYHLDGNHGGLYPRTEEFTEFGIPYIGANSISSGMINFSMAKFLPENRANQLKKGIAKDDDVLFAHNATVGPVALLKTKEKKIILSTSLTAYRCNKQYVLPLYLRAYMMSAWFEDQYKFSMKQTTRNQIPITAQRKMHFVVPPLPLQQEFACKIESIEHQKETISKSIGETQRLFDYTMDKYFG